LALVKFLHKNYIYCLRIYTKIKIKNWLKVDKVSHKMAMKIRLQMKIEPPVKKAEIAHKNNVISHSDSYLIMSYNRMNVSSLV